VHLALLVFYKRTDATCRWRIHPLPYSKNGVIVKGAGGGGNGHQRRRKKMQTREIAHGGEGGDESGVWRNVSNEINVSSISA